MKKDVVWLDYARWIGMLLVIFGHAIQRMPQWNDTFFIKVLWDYIYLFHMPLFFVISGYLHRQEKLTYYFVWGGKTWRTLVIPYILYQLIYFPFALIHYKAEILHPSLWVKLMAGVVAGDGYDTPFSNPVCLPCWFIICIIQIRLLFLIIPIGKISSFLLCTLSVVTLTLRGYFHMDFYFCIDSTLMAIPYYLLGYGMKSKSAVDKGFNTKCLLAIAIFAGLSVYYILKCNGAAQMNGPSYGRNIFVNYIAGILGSFMVLAISKCLESRFHKRGFVRIISRNTLFLIFYHWLLLGITAQFFRKILLFWGVNTFSIITTALLITSIIHWISIITIKRMVDKCPMLFGKIK